MMSAKVFISHSADADLVGALASHLERAGYRTWYDKKLIPSQHFGHEITQELDTADAVIVIWTPLSTKSNWVIAEAQRAFNQDKLISTLAFGTSPDHLQLPFPIATTCSVDDTRAIENAIRLIVANKRQLQATATLSAPPQLADDAANYSTEPHTPPIQYNLEAKFLLSIVVAVFFLSLSAFSASQLGFLKHQDIGALYLPLLFLVSIPVSMLWNFIRLLSQKENIVAGISPIWRAAREPRARYHAFYLSFLRLTLASADQWFGKTLLSTRLLCLCATFALYYSAGFLLLAWSLTGYSKIGNLTLLPGGVAYGPRQAIPILAVFLGIAGLWFAERYAKFSNQLRDHRDLSSAASAMKITLFATAAVFALTFASLTVLFPQEDGANLVLGAAACSVAVLTVGAAQIVGLYLLPRTSHPSSNIMRGLTISFAVSALAISLGIWTASNISNELMLPVLALLTAIFGTGSIFVCRNRALAGIILVLSAMGGVGLAAVLSIVFGHGKNHLVLTALLFFCLLPLVNAVFDAASIAFSRFMGAAISEAKQYWLLAVLFYTTLDVVMGFALMFGLAMAIIVSLTLLEHATRGSLVPINFDIFASVEQALSNPLDPNSLWITLMLWTTMWATLLHFFIAATATVTMLFPGKLLAAIANNVVERRTVSSLLRLVFAEGFIDTLAFVAVVVALYIFWSFAGYLIVGVGRVIVQILRYAVF